MLDDLRGGDAPCTVNTAVDNFVERALASRGTLNTIRPLEHELAEIDATIDALFTGLDPANLPMINERLSRMRKRRELLQEQVRLARGTEADMDEAALRRWATERIGLLAEIIKGRRDDAARRLLACYVDELVIDPATKTGTLVVNANAVGLDPEPDGDEGDDAPASPHARDCTNSPTAADMCGMEPPASGPQKHTDPPLGGDGSQCIAIAGARLSNTLRPRGRKLLINRGRRRTQQVYMFSWEEQGVFDKSVISGLCAAYGRTAMPI